MMRIRYACPIGQCSEVCQTYINPNRLVFVGMFNNWHLNFTTEYCEPLTSIIDFDSQSLGFASGDTMKNDWDIPYLGAEQFSIGNKLEPRLRIDDALDSGFEAGKSSIDLLAFLSLFDSAKEVVKSLAQSVPNILKDLAVNFIADFRMAYFDVFHQRVKVKLFSYPKLFIQAKKLIIYKLAMLENLEKPYLLLRRRIQSVFIHSLNDHKLDIGELIFKLNGGNRQFIPHLKKWAFLPTL